MRCLLRRDYDAATLVREHPPKLSSPHKRLVYAMCSGASTTGALTVTRWAAEPLPATAELAPTELVPLPGHFDYADVHEGVWHVNFADPELFFAYGSSLLAQDELQCAEHPVLGSIREALLAEHQPAMTENDRDGAPTPVLVANVERRCAIDTAPNAACGRPQGLYGNRFAATDLELVRGAIHVMRPPTRSNLIAMAAPTGAGTYTRTQIEHVVTTAYTAFRAAIEESNVPVEVCTGFWGCGAFGGNRELMTLLQILAARLAGVARLRFYVFDDAGRANFDAGLRGLDGVLRTSDEPLPQVLDRIADLDYRWGASDGN